MDETVHNFEYRNVLKINKQSSRIILQTDEFSLLRKKSKKMQPSWPQVTTNSRSFGNSEESLVKSVKNCENLVTITPRKGHIFSAPQLLTVLKFWTWQSITSTFIEVSFL